jgi:hypothetical protein
MVSRNNRRRYWIPFFNGMGRRMHLLGTGRVVFPEILSFYLMYEPD